MKQNVITNTAAAVRNGTARCVGPMVIQDEETRKHFTDSEGRVHSVVFLDPDTGARCFGY